jgi:heme oxygenase
MNLSPVYEQWRQSTIQEGQANLVIQLLTRRVGMLPGSSQETIRALSMPNLEELGVALSDFRSIDDLLAWLESHQLA